VTPPSEIPVLGQAAYHGLTGRFLQAVAPYTEAPQAGILAHLLPVVGMLVGPHPHVFAGNKQPPRINSVLVGPTKAGRKGTAAGLVKELMRRACGRSWDRCHRRGLSSAEGLIVAVADRTEMSGEGLADPVGTEKRLYVLEEELASVLIRMKGDGNTLSCVLRQAFDDGDLATLTVKSRQASGSHICVVGHITPEELEARLQTQEITNGWVNRFLWFQVHKSQQLPSTEPLPEDLFGPFLPPLQVLELLGSRVRAPLPVTMDQEADRYWRSTLYNRLSRERPGLYGKATSRGETIVLRLALIYALLDCSTGEAPRTGGPHICLPHLEAASAVWEYSEQSAFNLFGHRTESRLGDKVMLLLRGGPRSRKQLNRHCSNPQKAELEITLGRLKQAGLIRSKSVVTGGRHATVWELAPRT
jgi:hypothetical protein